MANEKSSWQYGHFGEGLDPSLVEEVSAIFPVAAIQRPDSFVTVMTRFDPKTGQLFSSIFGAQEEAINTLLASPEGLDFSAREAAKP